MKLLRNAEQQWSNIGDTEKYCLKHYRQWSGTIAESFCQKGPTCGSWPMFMITLRIQEDITMAEHYDTVISSMEFPYALPTRLQVHSWRKCREA